MSATKTTKIIRFIICIALLMIAVGLVKYAQAMTTDEQIRAIQQQPPKDKQ